MQVNKNNVTQFMAATNTCFMVPVYQRNYDWREDNCKQLWHDLTHLALREPTKTHFLGTICTKTINGHERSIIDGQQRLTTITLLIKAMHDYVDNNDFKSDLDSTFLRNTGFGVQAERKVKLHLNRRDDAIYNALLNKKTFTGADELSSDEASSSIYQNYAFFYEQIQKLSDEQILEVRNALDRLIIVDLDVEAENPQEIFESLNSTGLDLTDVDLLRNYLLMSLDYETQTRLFENYWYPIEQNVGPANMVRFFVDYLIYVRRSDSTMIHGRRGHINEKNLYVAFKDHYASISKEHHVHAASKDATEAILSDMHACSYVYKRLVFAEDADMNAMGEIDRTIYSILYPNQALGARPLLLYIMSGFLDQSISETNALEMLNACLSLVVRARVFGNGRKGINGQFCGNVLQRLPETSDANVVRSFWQGLTSGKNTYAFPTDAEFEEALLNRNIFDALRSRGTKYLLYALEQHSKAAKGLPSWNNTSTTIEHIMPQTLSPVWEEYLGEDVALHGDFLNKLGNLALTSNNGEMSNKPFDVEQDGAVDKRSWYRESSFHYTREIADAENWSVERIRERSELLAQKCLEVWSMPEDLQSSTTTSKKKQRPPFRFSMIGLVHGDQVALAKDPSKIAVVADESHVTYEGVTYSLTRLAKVLLDKNYGISGPWHFTYKGRLLNELRNEAEASRNQNGQEGNI